MSRDRSSIVLALCLTSSLSALGGCSLVRSPIGALGSVDAGAADAPTPTSDAGPLDAPVLPMDAPALPIDAPVLPVDAPVLPIDAPVLPIDAPVLPIDAPVLPTDAPVRIDAPIAPADAGCPAGALRCTIDGTSLETCMSGSWSSAPCSLGCAGAPTPHCRQLVPSNVPASLFAAGGDVVISADATWDTGACATLPGMPMQVTQIGGGDACVVRVTSLTVESGHTLSAVGLLPLIVLATGDVEVLGEIDVSAYGTTRGPGGGRASNDTVFASGPGAGDDGGHSGTFADGGGAGGALCGGGGAGGQGGAAATTPGPTPVTTDLRPLVGGSGGGAGGSGGSMGFGGAGGGALQITARGRIVVSGTILSGGGGGEGGDDGVAGDNNIGAGGGGGSGGAVLLEAPVVDVTGSIRANGGGGGGAAGCSGRGRASSGTDGAAAATSAAGGARGPSCADTSNYGAAGGAGGGGGLLGGAPGGGNGTSGANGGGGGGGAGCIVVRSAAMALPGGTLSPSIAPGVRALPIDAM